MSRAQVCSLPCRSGVGYQCIGSLTEWTKCTNIVREPKRRLFTVPKELADEYPFLNSYRCELGRRVMEDLGQTSASQQQQKAEARANATPLTKLTFVVAGEVDEAVTRRVMRMGGKIGKSVTSQVAAVICTRGEWGSECRLGLAYAVRFSWPSFFYLLHLISFHRGRLLKYQTYIGIVSVTHSCTG